MGKKWLPYDFLSKRKTQRRIVKMKSKLDEIRKKKKYDLKDVSRVLKIPQETFVDLCNYDFNRNDRTLQLVLLKLEEDLKRSKRPKLIKTDVPSFVTVASYKGGVGKTSSIVSLASACATQGYRVLIVDAAGQGDVSSWLQQEDDDYEEDETIFSALINHEDIRKYIRQSTNRLVDYVPSSYNLKRIDSYLEKEEYRNVFDECFKGLVEDNIYDFVFFDTNSQMGLLDDALWLIKVAPVYLYSIYRPKIFSLKAYSPIMWRYEALKKENEGLHFIGIILNEVDERTSYSKISRETFNEISDGMLFDSVIHIDESLNWAQDNGLTIHDFKKSAKSAKDYTSLCKEFLNRIEMHYRG